MEIEGLICGVNHLQSHGLVLGHFVTDCHRQIAKWFKEKLSNTKHRYDIWHEAKSKLK